MIVPMKKLSIIVEAKDAGDALANVRRAGVVHIEHHKAPLGKDISALEEDISALNKALLILVQEKPPVPAPLEPVPSDEKTLCRDILAAKKRLNVLDDTVRSLDYLIAAWKTLDVDPARIASLRNHGVYATLYLVPKKNIRAVSATIS
jgi:vacuolar-type H+-ATPase subunit I/STV1